MDVAAAACLAVVAPDSFRLEVNVYDSSPDIPRKFHNKVKPFLKQDLNMDISIKVPAS